MDGVKLAEWVDEKLKEFGIKKSKFFDDTGISSATLSQWRNGQYSPSKSALKKVADFFNISVEELIGGKKESAAVPGSAEELNQYLNALKNDPNQRVLFNLVSNATVDEVKATVAFLRTLRGQNME